MKKTREQLCDAITRQIDKFKNIEVHHRPGKIRSFSMDIYKKHNIPMGDSVDYLSRKKPLEGASDFVLFSLLEALEPSLLTDYFMEKEIDTYSNGKLEEKRIKYPLTLPAVQVASDQWIGVISVQTLMLFRDAHLIELKTGAQSPSSTK